MLTSPDELARRRKGPVYVPQSASSGNLIPRLKGERASRPGSLLDTRRSFCRNLVFLVALGLTVVPSNQAAFGTIGQRRPSVMLVSGDREFGASAPEGCNAAEQENGIADCLDPFLNGNDRQQLIGSADAAMPVISAGE